MPISKLDVEKIAELARLDLTGEQTESFAEQLSSILGYIDKLNELDTADIEPMSHSFSAATQAEDARRDDLTLPSLGQRLALENAPDAEGGYFKVPRVIGG